MKIREETVHGVPFLRCDGFGPGVAHGFSTRLGGVSEGVYASMNLGFHRGDDPDRVRENFDRFCGAVEVAREGLVCSAQVHGDEVRVCTRADRGRGIDCPAEYEADALVTDVPGLVLAVFTADCLPILLHDPVRQVVAAVHAGWRGTALGVVERTVERMSVLYGSHPEDLLAAIGPGIGPCCFVTHEDVPNAMTEALGAAALGFIESAEGGKFRVDLRGLNTMRLERAGLLPGKIAAAPQCTCCESGRFWSHRATGGERGSMAALISLR